MLSWSSSKISLCCLVTITFTAAAASDGACWLSQNPPVQIGNDTLPASNSIHTAASTSGRKANPTESPAYGTHGIAHPDSVSPNTDGTLALMRMVAASTCVTVPRYFPKKRPRMDSIKSWMACSFIRSQPSQHSREPAAIRGRRPDGVSHQHEAHLVGLRADRVPDAPHQIV